MESTLPTSSRRRAFSHPKNSPDAGLAEWASRIKAIQQDVDRDEEAEQRRLQDEITRSRMERAQRRNTATVSVERMQRVLSSSNYEAENAASVVDGQRHQSEAPSKLLTKPSPSELSTSAMAGTGLRLNNFILQQDPALFPREGPSVRTNEAVAVTERLTPLRTPKDPSLETRKHKIEGFRTFLTPRYLELAASSSKDVAGQAAGPPHGASASPAVHLRPRNQTSITPPQVAAKPILHLENSDRAPSASHGMQDPSASNRVRTPPESPTQFFQSQTKLSAPLETAHGQRPGVAVPSKPPSLAEVIGGRASGPRLNKQPSREVVGDFVEGPSLQNKTGMQRRALPGLHSPEWPSQTRSPNVPSSPQSINSFPSLQQSPPNGKKSSPTHFAKRPTSGSKVSTPSLARPVQPQVIVQPSPIAAVSTTASPAFLRAQPSTQELHPSLSRLQGRGFVERQVKASASIYGSSASQPVVHSTGASGKRPSVLNRWKPTSVSPPPHGGEAAAEAEAEETSTPSHLISTQQVIRPFTTSPAVETHGPPTLGEAKPMPLTPRSPGVESSVLFPLMPSAQRFSSVHAIAQRGSVGHGASKHGVENTTPAPLIHPTRDRARKPRKKQPLLQPVSRASVLQTETPERTVDMDNVCDNDSGDRPLGHISQLGPTGTVGSKSPERESSPETEQQLAVSTNTDHNLQNDVSIYQISAKLVVTVPPPNATPSNAADSAPVVGKPPHLMIVAPSPRPISSTFSSSSPEEVPPSRHSRVPSTGQRATVMDVAQALQALEQHIRESSLTPEPDAETLDVIQPRIVDDPSVPPSLSPVTTQTHCRGAAEGSPSGQTSQIDAKSLSAGRSRNINNVGSGFQQAERRRSAYDRYSITTLPPLAEEKTPIPTPDGSLSRGFAYVKTVSSNVQDVPQNTQDGNSTKDNVEESSKILQGNDKIPVGIVAETLPESVNETLTGVDDVSPAIDTATEAEKEISFEHQDRPPPGFNLHSLLKEASYSPDPRLQTISVEVISIAGHIATAVTREPNVFYDSEVVAVVRRAKEKTNGLVSTRIWAWRGRNAEFGEREERKVLELAARLSTKGIFCAQGSEPWELVHVLGGVLAIRQGKRVHWTAENTTMHRIHRIGDSIFVDEIDLAIHNLCSAYSYCLSVLDALYIWHGRGSSEDERKVASAYGQSLANATMKITEFEEGKEDELFWMMLGDDGFANASHWKFKHQLERLGARLYAIDCSRPKDPVQLKHIFSGNDLPIDGVFVVDCRFELFVVVTPQARGKRTDIQLALFLAENISAATAYKRPFDPPVHVAILPSRLPLELQAAIRLCNEAALNEGTIPDHMNILHLPEALDHIKRRSWPISALSDLTFLPLGIDPRMLSIQSVFASTMEANINEQLRTL